MDRPIDLVVIHCSATKNGGAVSVNTIRQWHLARGFSGVGYHYVITIDGKLNATRIENMIGAHALGHNGSSLGICMVGGLGGPDKQNPGAYTMSQWDSLRWLVKDILVRHPNARVCGHRDLSPDLDGDGEVEPNEWIKLCPCFEVKDWLENGMVPVSEHVLYAVTAISSDAGVSWSAAFLEGK